MTHMLAIMILSLSGFIFYFGLFWILPYFSLNKNISETVKCSLLCHGILGGVLLISYGIWWSLKVLGV
jgi:hypothetical protein